jgi:small subunit ribosomal protein S20
MSQHKSSERRIKVSLRASKKNAHYKSMMKTAIKRVKTAQNKEKANEYLRKAVSLLDKMVNKDIIHKNKAANQKSKLTKFIDMKFKAPLQTGAS